MSDSETDGGIAADASAGESQPSVNGPAERAHGADGAEHADDGHGSDGIDRLVAEATEAIEGLTGGGKSSDEELQAEAERLVRVAKEAVDLLDTVHLGKLMKAVDPDELPEAIDFAELPAAIRDGEPKRAIKMRKLLTLVDLDELWKDVDIKRAWKEKEELDEAIEDLTENGPVRTDDGDEDDEADEGVGPSVPAESIEAAVQSKVRASVEEFREALIVSHRTFYEQQQAVKRQFEQRTERSSSSRNPTAVSLEPRVRADMGHKTQSSTVPRDVRYSNVPGFDRLYGDRYEQVRTEGQNAEVERDAPSGDEVERDEEQSGEVERDAEENDEMERDAEENDEMERGEEVTGGE